MLVGATPTALGGHVFGVQRESLPVPTTFKSNACPPKAVGTAPSAMASALETTPRLPPFFGVRFSDVRLDPWEGQPGEC